MSAVHRTPPPIALSERRLLRLLTLCALYLAQGIPFGFVVITLKSILAGRGLGAGELGWLLGTALLPWAFKWIWGPIIDRFGLPSMGRRRPWILLAQGLMALSMGLIIGLDDLLADLRLLGALLFLHNVFAALQDVAVDALAIDLLDERERGRANGLMYGSKYLGTLLGGAGLATVAQWGGLRTALITQIAALLLIFLLPLLLRERPGERLFPWSPDHPSSQRRGQSPKSLTLLFRRIFQAFSNPSALAAVFLALLASIAAGFLSPVGAVLFTQRLGWTPETLAQIEGSAYIVGLIGAVLGGFLVDRFSARAMIATGLLGLASTWIIFAALEPWWELRFIPTTVLYIEPLFQSLSMVGMFALFMGISWSKVAATQFTAYVALLNLSSSIGGWAAGPLNARLGIAELYLVGAAVEVLTASLLLLIQPKRSQG